MDDKATPRVGDAMLPIGVGDVVFVPVGPEFRHPIVDASDRPIDRLSISTMEEPQICVHPDSGTLLAEGSPDSAALFEVIDRRGRSLDDWDGGP